MERDKLVHDLEAPVNNLKMLITILEKNDLDKAKLLEHLKRITSQIEKNNIVIISELKE